jgi:hypothetical protein
MKSPLTDLNITYCYHSEFSMKIGL